MSDPIPNPANKVMRDVLSTIADENERVIGPGAGDCVREMANEKYPVSTRADYLHAAIFGSHEHSCPDCGRTWRCSDPFDCQPGPRLCPGCYLMREPPEECE